MPNQKRHKKIFNPADFAKPRCPDTDEWMLRESERVYALSDEKLALVNKAIEVHNARLNNPPVAAAFTKSTPVLQEMLDQKRKKVVTKIIAEYYRTPSARWVGGNIKLTVKIGPIPDAFGVTFTVWNNKKGWSGHDVSLTVTLQRSWLSLVASVPGLADAGGMLTTHAEQVAAHLWKASWVEQGRGFGLKAVSGYILHADGRYYRGKTQASTFKIRQNTIDALEAERRKQVKLLSERLRQGYPVSPYDLRVYPELADVVYQIEHEKEALKIEAILRAGGLVDPEVLMNHPYLLVKYGL